MCMKLTECLCEHSDHFKEPAKVHEYGQEFDTREIHDVVTRYGTFAQCAECTREHPLTGYAKES